MIDLDDQTPNPHVEAIWALLAPYIASEDPPELTHEAIAEALTAGVLPNVWEEVLALERDLNATEMLAAVPENLRNSSRSGILGPTIQVVMPHGAMGQPYPALDFIESSMRTIAVEASWLPGEWPDKYGTDHENEVFMMHRYCWCEGDDCKWCSGDEPNFLHKGTGFKVTWYKYIGRSMEIDMAGLNAIGVARIISECMDSLGGIPTDGRD